MRESVEEDPFEELVELSEKVTTRQATIDEQPPIQNRVEEINVFKKKNCWSYNPKDPQDDSSRCTCGRKKHKSFINGGWENTLDTERVDGPNNESPSTNAFGEITFYGTERNTKAKYLRLSDTSKPSEVVEYMIKNWEFNYTGQLLISVIGSANSYIEDTAFAEVFKQGLRKVVISTSAWVFTSGTNVGVSQLVGEALHDVSQLDSTSSEFKKFTRVRCVGIFPWGVVQNRKQLTHQKETENDENMSKNVRWSSRSQRKHNLEPNHTHFLLVDDGTVGQYYGEEKFKNQLESFLTGSGETATNYSLEDERTLETVKLVVGGGPSVISSIKATIENHIPVILFKETSQAAALFSYAYELRPLEECSLAEIEEHQTLLEMIGQEYPDLTLKERTNYYDMIMECMREKNYVRNCVYPFMRYSR